MNKTLACLAVTAALLPCTASAAYFTDTATVSFQAAATSVTATFGWLDPLFHNSKTGKDNDLDGAYSWVLKDTDTGKTKFNSFGDKVTGDKNNVVGGSFANTFDNLKSGHHYELSFTGEWSGEPTGKNWSSVHGGDVTLAVPEPETYAMLLAGLGLIGTIARRRSSARR
jgi:hypothetical protein